MEVIVAMVLLASVGAITMHAFSTSVRVSSNTDNVACNFGRGLLEQVYERVRQDQWNAVGWPLSPPGPAPQTTTLNGTLYRAVWTVTPMNPDGDGQEDYRRVQMKVCWNPDAPCPAP